ncbi:MAG: hypothetical protein J6I73_05110 [Treponema sp.]|nr:hypothetical protein [Treponema sp.]
MKAQSLVFIIFAATYIAPLCAQTQNESDAVLSVQFDEQLQDDSEKNAAMKKPFVTFNEGVTLAHITRLIKQDDYKRSNFVWQNYLIGLYFEMQTVRMRPFNSLFRVAVYYPFKHTFNGMNQQAKQLLLYAFDAYAGFFWQRDMWKYIRVNFSVGPHFLYELSDEYHHIQLGGALLAGLELPVAHRWTIINNGIFALDYPNLGSNRSIAPYNLAWEYQLELGLRYSRRENVYAYIHKINKNSTSQTDKAQPSVDAPSDSAHSAADDVQNDNLQLPVNDVPAAPDTKDEHTMQHLADDELFSSMQR